MLAATSRKTSFLEAPMPRRTDSPPSPPLDRGAILDQLREAGVPMPRDELAQALGIKGRQREAFDATLDEAVRAGDVLVNRKGELLVAAKLDLVRGRVQGHADGYGFLVPDAGGDDVFLSPREMHKLLHGDRAAVRVTGTDRRGRPEGEIVEVLERVNREVVGRLHHERGAWFVEAEDRRLSQDILIGPEDRGNAQPGEVVVVDLTDQPSERSEAAGRVVEVLGRPTDPGMEIEIALRKHALPFQFSDAAKAQAAKLPKDVRPADRRGREDLRGLPLVTIDGETAKDFDDAVYCERKGKGFRLVVAIADVSLYVRDGDALDRDARERGNSVYFPRRVIPMLPEELSNELCSLRPVVDRLCMVCDMDVAASGEIRSYRFYPAVMHSRARLTYTKVWQWLSDPASRDSDEARALGPHVDDLYALFKVLLAAREKRGAIDFDTVELALIFDDEGRIEKIVPVQRNDAHRLIEECMLAANVCTADFLQEHQHPALYRVHEGPTPEKLEPLRAFLGMSALALGGGAKPQPSDYAKLIAQIEGRPDQSLLQTVLLRSLSQAQYHPDNVGHFGLAFDAYTHFTSPIRRYPDLTVHRAIKACLAGKRYTPKDSGWEALGAHCSMSERRADDATRDVERWLKCWYMKDRIGDEYEGTISGVAGFGIFVTLDGMNVDGLVHISDLGRDYFHFDKVRHALVGERGGRVFQLAGRLRVRVARVDLETTKIDFVLAEDAARTQERPAYSQPLERRPKVRKPGR